MPNSVSDSAAGHFFQDALDRIGLSERGVRYAYFIADNLIPALQAKLRGTPAEDNQSRLLALAKLPAGKQKQLVRALDKTGGDIDEALLVIDDERPAKPSASPEAALDAVFDLEEGDARDAALLRHRAALRGRPARRLRDAEGEIRGRR